MLAMYGRTRTHTVTVFFGVRFMVGRRLLLLSRLSVVAESTDSPRARAWRASSSATAAAAAAGERRREELLAVELAPDMALALEEPLCVFSSISASSTCIPRAVVAARAPGRVAAEAAAPAPAAPAGDCSIRSASSKSRNDLCVRPLSMRDRRQLCQRVEWSGDSCVTGLFASPLPVGGTVGVGGGDDDGVDVGVELCDSLRAFLLAPSRMVRCAGRSGGYCPW